MIYTGIRCSTENIRTFPKKIPTPRTLELHIGTPGSPNPLLYRHDLLQNQRNPEYPVNQDPVQLNQNSVSIVITVDMSIQKPSPFAVPEYGKVGTVVDMNRQKPSSSANGPPWAECKVAAGGARLGRA